MTRDEWMVLPVGPDGSRQMRVRRSAIVLYGSDEPETGGTWLTVQAQRGDCTTTLPLAEFEALLFGCSPGSGEYERAAVDLAEKHAWLCDAEASLGISVDGDFGDVDERRDDGIAAAPLGGDLEDAIRQARELNARARKERVDYKVQSARETVLAQAAEIALNAKKRAKARELEFALTADDIIEMLEEQDGRCALSGIPFDAETRLGHRRPYKPSIDRVDSSRGYLRDNVRLVCVAINYALGDWGEAVLVHLAERIVATRKMKSRARTSD